jgi:hypothetical protein
LVLSLKGNHLGTKESGVVLAEMLKANSVLKALDVSSNFVNPNYGGDGPGFAQGLAAGISDNEAMTSLNLSKNGIITRQAGRALADMLRANSVLAELNVSNCAAWTTGGVLDGPGFAQELAVGISGNAALSLANVMGNRIGMEMRSKLQDIMRSKPTLISLCGIADDATEVDLSGLGMDADDAIILASELPDKGGMTSLNLASNMLDVEGAKIIATFLPKWT